jgi:hypothetical protein
VDERAGGGFDRFLKARLKRFSLKAEGEESGLALSTGEDEVLFSVSWKNNGKLLVWG